MIDKLDLELDPHLNIITGETGAGKSILLGALGLLLGNKNESGTIRDEGRNCIIEGVFDIEAYGLITTRENSRDSDVQTLITTLNNSGLDPTKKTATSESKRIIRDFFWDKFAKSEKRARERKWI